MNDTEQFKLWLEERGNVVTLSDILKSHHAAEYRKHFTYLRKSPYFLDFRPKKNIKEPGKNLYTLQNKGGDVENANQKNIKINKKDSTLYKTNMGEPVLEPTRSTIFDEVGQGKFI